MKKLIVPRTQFDLDKFVKAVHDFNLSMGVDEAFLIVEDGVAVNESDFADLLDDGEAEIPNDPVDRLKAGHTLFCHFALCRDFDLLVCADGTEIEVPDLDAEEDEDDEDEGENEPTRRLTTKQRKLIEKTCCDENRSYGILLALEQDKLVFQSVLSCDLNGQAEVEITKDTGLVEKPIVKFINSFVRKAHSGVMKRRE